MNVHTFLLPHGVPSASGCLQLHCLWFLFAVQILIYACEKQQLIGGDNNWSRKTEPNCSRFARWRGEEPREPIVCEEQTANQKKLQKKAKEKEVSGQKDVAEEPDKPCSLYLLKFDP